MAHPKASVTRPWGDPHGSAPAAVEGKFLSDFFFGSQTLTGAEADRLNTDPYAL
jgi:hypothetical protein